MTAGVFKIEREALSEKVEKTLKKMLADGRIKEGERFPSENEMAKSFGVSRQTVRIALQKLSVQGLVDIRTGDGTYAKEFSLRSYLGAASDLYITTDMIADVGEFRKAMELECIRLAMKNATEDDFKRIQESIDVYILLGNPKAIETEAGKQKYVDADLDIHYQICRAAHNSLFEVSFNATRVAVSKFLYAIISKRQESGNELYTTEDGIDAHQLILNAIRDRDFDQARYVYDILLNYEMERDEYRRALSFRKAQAGDGINAADS